MLGRCSTSGQDERGLVSGAGRPLRAAESGAGTGDEFVTPRHRPGRPSRDLCFCSAYPQFIPEEDFIPDYKPIFKAELLMENICVNVLSLVFTV